MQRYRIVIYTAIMVTAMYFGKKGIMKKFLKNKLPKIQTMLLFLLLFIMGISIGKNKNVLDSLSTIGIKAFFMAAVIIAVTVFTMYIYDKLSKLIKVKKRKS